MDGTGRHREAACAQGAGQPAGQRRFESVLCKPFRIPEDFLRRSLDGDVPIHHHRDAVHPDGFFGRLRDEDHAQPVFIHDRQEQGEYVLAVAGVQRRGGLVADEVTGPHRRHGSDGHPLFLAAGQPVGRIMAVLSQVEPVECPRDPLVDLAGRQAEVFKPEGQFPLHRGRHQLVVRILEDHPGPLVDAPLVPRFGRVHAVHQDPAGLGHDQPIETAGEGTLSRAVGSDHGHAFGFADLEGQAAQRGDRVPRPAWPVRPVPPAW